MTIDTALHDRADGAAEWPEPRDAVLADAARRARRYLATLDERAVAPNPGAIARLHELDVPLPRESTPARRR